MSDKLSWIFCELEKRVESRKETAIQQLAREVLLEVLRQLIESEGGVSGLATEAATRNKLGKIYTVNIDLEKYSVELDEAVTVKLKNKSQAETLLTLPFEQFWSAITMEHFNYDNFCDDGSLPLSKLLNIVANKPLDDSSEKATNIYNRAEEKLEECYFYDLFKDDSAFFSKIMLVIANAPAENATDKYKTIYFQAQDIFKEIILSLRQRNEQFNLSSNPGGYAEQKVTVNSKTINIILDKTLGLRLRRQFLDKDLSALTDEELLPFIAVDIYGERLAEGGEGYISRSSNQVHWCSVTKTFQCNEKNKKALKVNHDHRPSLKIFSQKEQEIIRGAMGKTIKNNEKQPGGVYFLHNLDSNSKKVAAVMPFVDGESMFSLIYGDDYEDVSLENIALIKAEIQDKDNASKLKQQFFRLIKTIGVLHAKGMLHRDIKLDNIMLNKAWELFLVDTGFMISINEPYSQISGTNAYIPLGMFTGELPALSHYQDIFAIALSILECFRNDFAHDFIDYVDKVLSLLQKWDSPDLSDEERLKEVNSVRQSFVGLRDLYDKSITEEGDDYSFLKPIVDVLSNPEITAKKLLENIFFADAELRDYVFCELVKSKENEFLALSVYYIDLPKEERESFIHYVIDCYLGVQVFVLLDFIDNCAKAGVLLEVEMNELVLSSSDNQVSESCSQQGKRNDFQESKINRFFNEKNDRIVSASLKTPKSNSCSRLFNSQSVGQSAISNNNNKISSQIIEKRCNVFC